MPAFPRFLRHGPASVAALVLLVASAGLAAQPGAVEWTDRIEVSGRGTVHGEPDVARVHLGAERADPDVEVALAEANEAIEAVRAVLSDHGIEARDVRTATFDVRQDTPRDREGRPLDTTYRVVHLLDVRVPDLDDLGALLTDAVEAGADRIGAIRFEFKDPTALEDEARALAVEDARRKAQRLADATGRTLGPVRVVREFGGVGLGGEVPTAELLDARAVGSDVPVAGGTLEVSVLVEVTFGLEE